MMSSRFTRFIATSAAVFVIAIAGASRLGAIAPWVIMIYGEPLTQPVFVTSVRFFHDVNGPTFTTVADMGNRPFLKLAMFWGPAYQRYVDDPRLLVELKPEQAGQHGRLYVRTPTQAAMVLQTALDHRNARNPSPIPTATAGFTWGGVLTDSQSSYLRSLGVPIDQAQWLQAR